MELGRLIDGLGIGLRSGRADLRVCDLTEDSRSVVPGSLFVARRGVHADGRKFVQDAERAGAVAVLTDDESIEVSDRVALLIADDLAKATAQVGERFYGDPSSKLKLVGITGTNGKTTVAHSVYQVLNSAGVRTGLCGTIVIDDGVETARASLTTPQSIELSRTLSVMVESGLEAAAIEVSSHAVAQDRVGGLSFDVGVYTNLSGDHQDYHGSMDAYLEAKRRLFLMLPEDGVGVVNADDPACGRMIDGCKARIIRTSLDPATDAEAHARIVEQDIDGMTLVLSGAWGEIETHVRLIGRHNVSNVLQAACVCHAMGVDADQLAKGLEHVAPPPGRLERVTWPDGADESFTVLVDFAHTDDALRSALTAVRGALNGRGRLLVVFGCGGDRDRTKRPRMGAIASELGDRVIVTSDNPRTERPSEIISEVLSGIDASKRSSIGVHADRREAIRAAIETAEPGDAVVIAGKGHETEQILPAVGGGVYRIEFDDRQVAREMIEAVLSERAEVEG